MEVKSLLTLTCFTVLDSEAFNISYNLKAKLNQRKNQSPKVENKFK